METLASGCGLMSCLGCGAPLPRATIGLCAACALPRVGREPTPAEARYRVLRSSLPALEREAKRTHAERKGLARDSIEAQAAWLLLGPTERADIRSDVLEVARIAADAPVPPPPGSHPEPAA